MKNPGEVRSNDETLPVASLRLLAPPLRLVSAAVWKVMQQRDVMHYGKLEEFVTSISEIVPGLLNYRHQAKLTVGLQAQLILQQLRASSSPNPNLILPQLERLHAPTIPKGKRKDQKVEVAVKNFHTLVHMLLKDPAGRERFFQEEFDSQYGPQYELALEKLLWEFLTRLDQLLPVPDLAQTVSWLSSAPAILEECARSATEPQLLSALLQHQKCLGHLDSAASLPSAVGDSILSSLSLPPSGKVQDTNHSGSTSTPNDVLNPPPSATRSQTRRTRSTESQIAPVIGTISSKDLPRSTSASQVVAPVLEIDMEDTYTQVKLRSRRKSESLKNVLKEDVSEEEHWVGNMLVSVVSQSSSSEVEENGNDEDDSDDDDDDDDDDANDDDDMRPVRRILRSRRISDTGKRETKKSPRVLEQKKSKKERFQNSSKNSPKILLDSNSQQANLISDVIKSCKKRHLTVNIPRLDISKITQPVLLNTSANQEQKPPSPSQSSPERVCRVRNGDSVNRKRKFSCVSTPEKNLTSAVNTQ